MFEPERFTEKAVDFIKKSVKELERDGCVIGISGGVDSSVVASLGVKAMGRKKVFGLILPERDSSTHSLEDALLLAEHLGIKKEVVDMREVIEKIGAYNLVPDALYKKRKNAEKIIKGAYKALPFRLKPFFTGLVGVKEKILRGPTAYYRIKHRLRMVLLYFYAEKMNYAVLGTTNRTEELLGFFVKYGDSATDIAPIACLYKTEVFHLARYLGIPQRIIEKPPSPDLIPGITDEMAIGMKYEKIDQVIKRMDMGMDDRTISNQTGISPSKIRYIRRMMEKSAHMRNSPLSMKREEVI